MHMDTRKNRAVSISTRLPFLAVSLVTRRGGNAFRVWLADRVVLRFESQTSYAFRRLSNFAEIVPYVQADQGLYEARDDFSQLLEISQKTRPPKRWR